MHRARLPALALPFLVMLPTSARAMTCAEILAAVAAGTPTGQITADIQRAPTLEAGLLQCLVAGSAPADVIAAAAARLTPRPATPSPATPEPAPAPPVALEPSPAIAPARPAMAPRPRPRPAPRRPARPVAAAPPAMAPALPVAPPPPVDHAIWRPVDEEALRINGFVDTAVDPLSTFSVDVDTGSYTLTRRTLRSGALPPRDAVRVEEFVNYLPYEYARPRSDQPFTVDIEVAPSPFDDETWYARVGVQGRRVAFDERKPVHLTFLVDTSGSMQSSDKIGLLKDALVLLTEELEDGDTVAIAAYAGSAGLVLPVTPISQRETILTAIRRLEAGGSTAMGAGIELAYAAAQAAYQPGHVNRVILASDGDANVGPTSHEALSQLISGHAKRGISLTTLGFGTGNYQDHLMEQIADDGDGNYFYIDSHREAQRVLVERMTSTLEIIARDVKLQVEWFPSSVLEYRLIGYENRDIADADFRNDKVDAGEVGAGHQVTALYEIRWDGPPGDLGVVRVRHKAPGPDAPSVESRFAVTLEDLVFSWEHTSDQFRMAAAAASFAEVLRDSPHTRHIDMADVEALAATAVRAEYEEDAEMLDLIRTARRLRRE